MSKAPRHRCRPAPASGNLRRACFGIVALLALAIAAPLAARAEPPAPSTQTSQLPPAPSSIADLRAAASRGDAGAQYQLAQRLVSDGVDEHKTEAAAWFRRAAEQGHAEAQAFLSWVYHCGLGVPHDDAEAVKWERLAAERGQASAQYYLGSDYELGLGGLPRDAAAAARWYRKAAEHDHPLAQARLGDLYADGRGVPRNDQEAVAWYRRASAQNNPDGQLGMGRMLAGGRGVGKDEKEAYIWFDRAAQRDDEMVGFLFEEGGDPKQRQLRRDYWLAMHAERQIPHRAAAQERDELAARMPPRDLAAAKRFLDAAAHPERALASPSSRAVPIAMPRPEEFCPKLAAVMAAAPANFAALRGTGSEEKGWAATEALPGVPHCSIQKTVFEDMPPYSYECEVSDGEDAEVALTNHERMRHLVSQCLGKPWRANEVRTGRSVAVFFANGEAQPMLVLSYRDWSSKHSVELRVDTPKPPILLAGSIAGKAIDLDAPVDLKTRNAGATDVFSAAATMLAADLARDVGDFGRVTLHRQSVPLHEVLDAVCAQVRCTWSFDTSARRPMLYLHH